MASPSRNVFTGRQPARDIVMANSVVTQEMVEAQTRRLNNALETNEAFRELDENFDEVFEEMGRVRHQPEVSFQWSLKRSQSKIFLRSFLEKVLQKRSSDYPQVDVDGLLQEPPVHDLSNDSRVWKMAAAFALHRLRPDHKSGRTKRSVSTAVREFSLVASAYTELTGLTIHKKAMKECIEYIQTNTTALIREKPIATMSNIVTFIRDGVFGDNFELRCPREQVQIALIQLIMICCAVCLSEILDGKRKKANGWSALRYGDLQFYLSLWEDGEDGSTSEVNTNKPLFRLHCNIRFKDLKGSRVSAPKWREQPLYSHGEEACLDAVLLLAYLADADQVFSSGLSIASVVKTADMTHFHNNQFLHIPIRAESKEMFVFRDFECTRYGGGAPIWKVASDKSLSTANAYRSIRKVARAAGLLTYTPYALRRFTLNAMVRVDISDGTKRLAVGHDPSGHCMERHYISKRITIDIQGLVLSGKENKALIVEHGIRKLPPGSLSHHKPLPNPAMTQQVDNLSVLEKRRLAAVATDEAYQHALSSGTVSQQELGRLRKEKVAVLENLTRLRRRLMEDELDRLTLNAAEQRDVQALIGSGPAAAISTLRNELQAGEGDQWDGGNDEPNGSSNNEDREDWQQCDALFHELATSSPQHYSNIQSYPEADGDADLIQLNARGEALAQRLRQSFDDLQSRFATTLPLPIPNYDRLKQPSRELDISDIFDSLNSENNGSSNAITDQLVSITGHTCTWCHKPLVEAVKQQTPQWSNRSVTVSWRSVNLHYQTCSREPAQDAYIDACRTVLVGQPRPHKKCAGKTLPTEAEDFTKHLDTHRKAIRDKIDQASKDRNVFSCPFLVDRNEECDWSLITSGHSHRDLIDALLHFETVHAFPVVRVSAVQRCNVHNHWLFGNAQIEEHYCFHAGDALNDIADFDFASEGLCPWCVQDDGLPWSKRGKDYDTAIGAGQQKHMASQHLWPHREPTVTCPICKMDMQTYELPQHLLVKHRLNFYRKTCSVAPDFSLDKVDTAFGMWYEGKRQEWLAYVVGLKQRNLGPALGRQESSAGGPGSASGASNQNGAIDQNPTGANNQTSANDQASANDQTSANCASGAFDVRHQRNSARHIDEQSSERSSDIGPRTRRRLH